MSPRILFLTESREDYLADSLLHGLISLNHDVTDFPRKDILYKNPSVPSRFIRGNGFTLYGLLDDRPNVDRTLIYQRLERNEFDLVILGQVWRQWGQLLDLSRVIQTTPTVLLDGDDDTRIFFRSLTKLRTYGLQRFPIRASSCFYLKRELIIKPEHKSRLKIYPTSFSIPQQTIRPLSTSKSQYFASHCVDPEVSEAFGLHQAYPFKSQNDYYDDLSRSFYAVTTKRGGWDCLRHYEIAAAGSVMCFRNLTHKPPYSAPHNLLPGFNCISYENLPDLQRQLAFLDNNPDEYNTILSHSRAWILRQTTTSVATRVLSYLTQI